ncbi:CBS domain-containing protein [Deinococcus reticulitermitis]|uniref:CBS domain-containing protein n=1 Tax=Deinococcus reticulitermitis TaxID=856736 RepID=A0A1H6XD96_9DEIO|nr:CBS domain-containing protein [Deinococcus reticulitermitis]SEJ22860.1 CBS domain-containing protein [Deinococcus reticulitermitis]
MTFTELRVRDAMHQRAMTINPNDTLPSAAALMDQLGIKRVPVVFEGKVVGLLTDGEVKRRLPRVSQGLTAWEFAAQAGRVRVRDAMHQPVHTLRPGDTLSRALHTMLDRRIGGLPVVGEQDDLLGMLTLTDILRAGAKTPDPAWGSVGEHMSRDVVSVTSHAPASEGVAKLRQGRRRVLPVLEGGMLLGVLHEVDVAAALEREAASEPRPPHLAHPGRTAVPPVPEHWTVRDLMRAPTGRVRPETPLGEVMAKMLELDVHGLPVVDSGDHVVGVVTISDVLKAVLGGPQP